MSRAELKRETEIKLRIESEEQGRARLRAAGFRLLHRRVHETNTIFDTPEGTLRAGGTLIRIREVGRRAVLTYKGPAAAGKHKSREELELQISHASMLAQILDRLGYRPLFRYEKYRTEYELTGQDGVATLDHTPIGDFLELEGAPAWIDRTAKRLGFREEDYVTESYGRLFLLWRESHKSTAEHMLFKQISGRLRRTSSKIP